MLRFFLWWFWPCRWMRALYWAFHGAVIMPSALLLGRGCAFKLNRGVKIGTRSRLIARPNGSIVVGEKTWMSTDVEIDASGEISIGADTTIQRRGSLNGTVRIGRGCLIGPNVFISSGVHVFHVMPHLTIREQELFVARNQMEKELIRPVWIQDDCWLGINVFVGPGVTIGKGSIIGANSVVIHDVPPYSIVAGVPGRVIDHRLEWVPGPAIDPAEDMHRSYILSGEWIAAHGNAAAKIRVTSQEALLLALAKNEGRNVSISYVAQDEITISVGGKEYTLSPRNNQFAVPSDDVIIKDDAWLLELKIVNGRGQNALDILHVECR